jgi:hypothetical protein
MCGQARWGACKGASHTNPTIPQQKDGSRAEAGASLARTIDNARPGFIRQNLILTNDHRTDYRAPSQAGPSNDINAGPRVPKRRQRGALPALPYVLG